MEASLIRFVNEELLIDHADVEVDAEDELLAEGLVDSLGVMRLVAYIEHEFGIAVPPEDITIEHFASIGVLAEYLSVRANGAGA